MRERTPRRAVPDLLTAAELAEIEKLYGGCNQGHAVDTCVFCWNDRALATIRALAEAVELYSRYNRLSIPGPMNERTITALIEGKAQARAAMLALARAGQGGTG